AHTPCRVAGAPRCPRCASSPHNRSSTASRRRRRCRDGCRCQPCLRLSIWCSAERYRACVSDVPPDGAAFPDLDDTQLAIAIELGERRPVEAGQILFSPADDHYDWIVVLSGSVDILGAGSQVITRHGPRRFLGEVNLVTRQRPYLTA